jgi:hypothetical protein
MGEEDEFGHIWEMGWEESENPHPGFGGSINIYGGYASQCSKCGMFGEEFCPGTNNPNQEHFMKHCGDIIRNYE